MNEENSPAAAPDMVPAVKHGRLLLGTLIGAALGLFALLQFVALPTLAKSLSSTPPVHLDAIKISFIALTSAGALAGLAVIWYGRKIMRAGQYPLPNAWVWRDTLIQRDRRARQFGWLHIAAGALMCLLSIGLMLYGGNLLERLTPDRPLRPGVIILQEKYPG